MVGPDSGFSWVIAFCCSYIHFALFGLFRSAGVMYVAFLQNYDVTREAASWPFALCAAVFQLVAPVAGVLTHYVSQRKVCLLGSAIATFGVGACYFAHSITWINVFYGLIHGLGYGLVVTVIPVILNQYFVKHRATAMGVAFSGGTISSLIFPSVMEWLLENYTLRDCFLLLSGVVMNMLVASSLLREPPWLTKTKQMDSPEAGVVGEKTSGGLKDSPKLVGSRDYSLVKTTELPEVDLVFKEVELENVVKNPSEINGDGPIVNGAHSDSQQGIGSEVSKRYSAARSQEHTSCYEEDSALPEHPNGKANGNGAKNNFPTTCNAVPLDALHKHELEVKEPLLNDKKIVIVPKKTVEPYEPKQQSETFYHSVSGVLREPMFHLITFTMAVYFLTVHSFFMVIVDFAKDKGIAEKDAIYIISVFSLTDLFGRAGLGWVTDRNFISRKTMVALNLGVLGIVNQLYPLVNSLEGILSVSAVHGLAVGSSITLFFVLQAECLGMSRLALVVGMTSFINGALSFLRPAIIGLFRDVIGTYNWMFHFLGFVSMVVSILWIVASLKSRDRNISKSLTIVKT